jgi:hypothetical protein
MPDRRAAEIPPGKIIAPGDDVGPGNGAEFFRVGNAGKAHEILYGVLVGAPGAGISNIGKPLDLRRHRRQMVKLGAGQQAI